MKLTFCAGDGRISDEAIRASTVNVVTDHSALGIEGTRVAHSTRVDASCISTGRVVWTVIIVSATHRKQGSLHRLG